MKTLWQHSARGNISDLGADIAKLGNILLGGANKKEFKQQNYRINKKWR